jgi:hypothetical protein
MRVSHDQPRSIHSARLARVAATALLCAMSGAVAGTTASGGLRHSGDVTASSVALQSGTSDFELTRYKWPRP